MHALATADRKILLNPYFVLPSDFPDESQRADGHCLTNWCCG